MSTRGFRIALAGALTAAILLPAARAHAAAPFVQVERAIIGGQVIDLDRDDVRDLLLLEAGRPLRVSWWSIHDGRPMQRMSAEVRSDALGLDAASLRVIQWHGLPRALVLLHDTVPETGAACCTVAFWVDGLNGRLEITPIDTSIPDGTASFVAFDLDGDGTDELMAWDSGIGDDPQRRFWVLHFNDGVLEPIGDPVDVAADTGWSPPGDSDGQPGAEVILGPDESGEVLRLGSAEGGGLRVEAALLPFSGGTDRGWVAGAVGGRMLIQHDGDMTLARWPAYGTLTPEGAVPDVWTMSGPLALANGATVVLASTNAAEPELVVLDPLLRELGRVHTPQTPAWWSLFERYPRLQEVEPSFPAWGPLGPMSRGLGWMFEGSLVRIADSGTPEVLVSDSLVGVVPIGAIGPDDAWIVLARRQWGMFGEFESMVDSTVSGSAVIVPLRTLQGAAGAPTIRLAGEAVQLTPGRAAAPEAEIAVDIAAPAGSRVVAIVDGRVITNHLHTSDASTITLRPPRHQDATEMSVLVVALTPFGRWSTAELHVEVLREPPPLEASEATVPANLVANVSGTTVAGSAVTVDGVPVVVSADGTFRGRVDATPWPRDVAVVATNVVGRRTTVMLSVVGLLDWRPIPWQIAITIALLALGVGLYLTAGRRRPAAAAPMAGAGSWEELDGGLSAAALDELVRTATPRDRTGRR